MQIRSLSFVLAVSYLVTLSSPVFAQGLGRLSFGASASGLGLHDFTGKPKTSPGFGGWFDVHVAPGLALEGRADWFPVEEAVAFEAQGGRTLKMMAGARGTFVETRRLRFYGLLELGAIRFSETEFADPAGNAEAGPRTHLAFDLGLGLELFPRARWSPRIDFIQADYGVPGVLLGPPSSNGLATAFATTPARIEDTFQISAGVGYRFGAPDRSSGRRSVAAAASSRRLAAGAQFAHGVRATIADLPLQQDPGFGGFVSYRVWRYLHADGAVTAFTGTSDVRTPWSGGRILQGLAGVKIGVQNGRVGLFGKVRVGVNSYADAFQGRDEATNALLVGRSTGPALDVGGVLEIDSSARSVLRFEAGRVTSFYQRRTIARDGAASEQGPAPSTGAIQMAFGAGWRF